MNKVILIGRITKDLEIKNTTNGTTVTNFSLAVQRRFKNQSGEYETDFFNCIAWRNTADFLVKHFKKGSMIAIVGNLQTRKWEDEKGTHYATDVVVDETYFCGGKSSSQTPSDSAPKDNAENSYFSPGEDLPF